MRRSKLYERVPSRVQHGSARPVLRTNVIVTRHDIRNNIGGNSSASIVSSSGFIDLPTALNDYVPDVTIAKPTPPRNVQNKPRKTLRSLDPALSPQRLPLNLQRFAKIRAPNSVPTYFPKKPKPFLPDRACYSSRSHNQKTELEDLQNEIKAHSEGLKLDKLKTQQVHKASGSGSIGLDELGNRVTDKAVQAAEIEKRPSELR